MGEIAEIAKNLVSPVNKLIDCAKSAFGKMYEPMHIKRMAKANAFALKTMQEAIDSNPELAQAYNSGMIQIDNKELNGLAIRGLERSLYQEMVKQQNLESIVAKTYGLLECEPDVPDEPVDQDWMARFVNSVETISDDDMQLLWAKILAGEIKQPKSYSLRTLEHLKNLSKEEALLFQKYSDYVITKNGYGYFINEESLLEKSGITVATILRFNDCGIANDSTFLQAKYTILPNESEAFYNDEIIVICDNSTSQSINIEIQVFTLTTFGNNLVSLIDKKTSRDFLLEFARYLKRRYSNITVSAFSIVSTIGTNINYDPSLDLIAQ